MTALTEVITLGSAVVFLAISTFAAFKRGEGPLTVPLGLMSLFLFAYSLADVLESVDRPAWTSLAYASASWAMIFALSLIAGFMGQRSQLRWLLLPLYGYFAFLGTAWMWTTATATPLAWLSEGTWAVAMLVGLTLGGGVLAYRLWRHTMSSPPVERSRGYLLASAFVLGFGGVTTDLAALAGAQVPRLAAVGLAATAVVLTAMVMFTDRLFARMTVVSGLTVVLLAAAAVLGQIVVVGLAAGRSSYIVFGTVLVAGFLLVGLYPFGLRVGKRMAQRRYHVALGRWTDRVRHNVINPLSTIKGSAEYLLEAQRRGQPIDPRHLEMIVGKVDQLSRTLRDYERLARREPARESTDVNRILRDLAAARATASGRSFQLDLADDLPRIGLDRDLMTAVFENLAKNAEDATPSHGGLRVVTRCCSTPLGARVRVVFEDAGRGMDPRTLERVFEPGFTTHEGRGRGLGLAYVYEVVHSHGGTVSVRSAVGRGTSVQIELPV